MPYGPIERLSYSCTASGCAGGGALLYLPLDQIQTWYALGNCRVLRNMVADPVLALIAIARVMGIDWKALDVQEWFSYSYKEGK